MDMVSPLCSGRGNRRVGRCHSRNAAGTVIERTPVTETYRGVYLAWDFQYTPATEVDAIVDALVVYLSQPVVPVELMSFSVE
jgi:hypothetical protein